MSNIIKKSLKSKKVCHHEWRASVDSGYKSPLGDSYIQVFHCTKCGKTKSKKI